MSSATCRALILVLSVSVILELASAGDDGQIGKEMGLLLGRFLRFLFALKEECHCERKPVDKVALLRKHVAKFTQDSWLKDLFYDWKWTMSSMKLSAHILYFCKFCTVHFYEIVIQFFCENHHEYVHFQQSLICSQQSPCYDYKVCNKPSSNDILQPEHFFAFTSSSRIFAVGEFHYAVLCEIECDSETLRVRTHIIAIWFLSPYMGYLISYCESR